MRRSAIGMGRRQWFEFLDASIGVSKKPYMDQAAIEQSLHGDVFALGCRIGMIAARSKVNQCATAAVLQNKEMSEGFGNAASHRNRIAILQRADRGWLEQHDTARLPALDKSGAAGSGSTADRKHGEHGTQTTLYGVV